MATTGYLHGSLRLSTERKGRKRKEPIWELRYRLPSGKDSTKNLGKAWLKRSRPAEGYLTTSQAEASAQAFLDEHSDSSPGSRKTFSQACDDFLQFCERERGLRGSTMHEYRRLVAVLCKRWGNRPLDTLTEADLITLRQELIGRGCKPHSLNQYRRVIRGAFGKVSTTDCWGWMAVKIESEGKLYFYTPEQVMLLKAAAEDDRDRAVFTLASESGPRMSEILALKVHNVDYEAGVIRIEDGYTARGGHAGTKGHKVRSVPMSANVQSALLPLCTNRPALTDGSPTLVFEEIAHSNIPLNGDGLRRRFKAAVKRAGLPAIRFHDLRHTFGTQLMASGKVDIYTLQRLMGHASITTTQRYLHYAPDPTLGATITGVFQSDEAEVIPLRAA